MAAAGTPATVATADPEAAEAFTWETRAEVARAEVAQGGAAERLHAPPV